MPEGPEVYTTAIFLNEIFQGMRLISLEHHTEKCLYGDPSNRYQGVVEQIRSRGKKLIIDLSSGDYIVVAMLMEGKLHLKPANNHLHVTLTFKDDNGKRVKLYYCESRPFGGIYYCQGKEDLDLCLKQVGIDLIQDNVTLEQWIEKWRSVRSKRCIAELLLDQTIFAGIGNYLRADILYHAKIHYDNNLETLSNRRLTVLYHSTMLILKKATKLKGLSFKSYSLPDGSRGKYESLIYNRIEDDDGNRVEKVKIAGRNLHWVPRIQKR